jgi:hypothetical protein
MQHVHLRDEDDAVTIHMPNGEAVEVHFDEVDPLVYLVSLDGETRTILIPKG